jgi:hypothetical protein
MGRGVDSRKAHATKGATQDGLTMIKYYALSGDTNKSQRGIT